MIILKKDRVIESVRKRFLPNYSKYKPHITLVYTFEVSDQKELSKHIKNITGNIKSFKLSLEGLKTSSKGYYLYLLANKGKDKLMKIYRNLNKGILKGLKNKDMPKYIPHITLGIFRSRKQISQAKKDLLKEKIRVELEIKSIQLLTFKKNRSIDKIKSYYLKK